MKSLNMSHTKSDYIHPFLDASVRPSLLRWTRRQPLQVSLVRPGIQGSSGVALRKNGVATDMVWYGLMWFCHVHSLYSLSLSEPMPELFSVLISILYRCDIHTWRGFQNLPTIEFISTASQHTNLYGSNYELPTIDSMSVWHLPKSGKLTVCFWKWPNLAIDLPRQDASFP